MSIMAIIWNQTSFLDIKSVPLNRKKCRHAYFAYIKAPEMFVRVFLPSSLAREMSCMCFVAWVCVLVLTLSDRNVLCVFLRESVFSPSPSARETPCVSFRVVLSFYSHHHPQDREGHLILGDWFDFQKPILISGKSQTFLQTNARHHME